MEHQLGTVGTFTKTVMVGEHVTVTVIGFHKKTAQEDTSTQGNKCFCSKEDEHQTDNVLADRRSQVLEDYKQDGGE